MVLDIDEIKKWRGKPKQGIILLANQVISAVTISIVSVTADRETLLSALEDNIPL